MAVILGGCFFGISVLASPAEARTRRGGSDLIVDMGRARVRRERACCSSCTQFATFAILILAANTAFADFPRCPRSSPDGFLPRQLANRGDRLVFSNGDPRPGRAAGVLIVVFGGDITALIPLYAVGVFTGFTLPRPAWSCTTAR